MDIVKDIASVVGLIISCFTLLTLCSNAGRSLVKSLFKKHNEAEDKAFDEVKTELEKIKEALDSHIKDSDAFKAETRASNSILLDFTKQLCRDKIVEIYETHQQQAQLPLREYKRLMYIEDIYINKLHGNSYASELINEMKTWRKTFPTNEE